MIKYTEIIIQNAILL